MRSGVLVVMFSVPAFAQCGPLWAPGIGVPGADNLVRTAVTWDPDGAGPATPIVAFGGRFVATGGVVTDGLATWDPATGVVGGLGVTPGQVNALAALPNGDLLVARSSLSLLTHGVERWDGASWTILGQANGSVGALLALSNGDVVAGGSFTSIGGVSCAGVARLSGGVWSPMAAGLQSPVNALVELPNGDVLAAGGVDSPFLGGQNYYVKRWAGATWTQMGGTFNNHVFSLAVMPNGDIIAGGRFTNGVVRWTGTTWASLGLGGNASVNRLAVLPSGALVAGGSFVTNTSGGIAAGLASWNGATWSPLAVSMGVTSGAGVMSITVLANGDIVAGGGFTSVNGVVVSNIARRSGSVWSPIAPGGIVGDVFAVAELPGGDLVAGGDFVLSGGGNVRNIARWNGTAWSPLGSGVNGAVRALSVLANGDLVAAGDFEFAGFAPVQYVARWNGIAWLPMGSGLQGNASTLTRMANGDLIAGGAFPGGAVRWDGVSWSQLGAGLNGAATTSCRRANGDLVVSGAFTSAGGAPAEHIAVWDGTTWSPLGSGLPVGSFVTEMPNGDLVAGGTVQVVVPILSSTGFLLRWDGVGWNSIGGFNQVNPTTLTALPDGDLLVGGTFLVGTVPQYLGRWDGVAWTSVGAGLNAPPKASATLAGGTVVFGGPFSLAGGQVSTGVAWLSTTCPATAQTSGTGCPSSGGSNTLVAATLPWVDATFRATGSGLPTNAIVLTLTSVTPIAAGVLPLTAVFPQAGPGCDVLTAPDILGVAVTTTGTVGSELFLPSAPPLVGVTFYHQMVPIEIDALGAWTAVSATNALQLVAGAF